MAAPYKRKCWIHHFMEVINSGSFLQSQFRDPNSVCLYHIWRQLWHSCRWLDESLACVLALHLWNRWKGKSLFLLFWPERNLYCKLKSCFSNCKLNCKNISFDFFLTFQLQNWICRAMKIIWDLSKKKSNWVFLHIRDFFQLVLKKNFLLKPHNRWIQKGAFSSRVVTRFFFFCLCSEQKKRN